MSVTTTRAALPSGQRERRKYTNVSLRSNRFTALPHTMLLHTMHHCLPMFVNASHSSLLLPFMRCAAFIRSAAAFHAFTTCCNDRMRRCRASNCSSVSSSSSSSGSSVNRARHEGTGRRHQPSAQPNGSTASQLQTLHRTLWTVARVVARPLLGVTPLALVRDDLAARIATPVARGR